MTALHEVESIQAPKAPMADHPEANVAQPRGPGTLEDVIEPYLMQQGFVMRTPRGRMAAAKAYERLGRKPPSAPPASGSLFGEK